MNRLTLLAEVDEEVLFGAEAVLQFIGQESFPIRASSIFWIRNELILFVRHLSIGHFSKVLIILLLLLRDPFTIGN